MKLCYCHDHCVAVGVDSQVPYEEWCFSGIEEIEIDALLCFKVFDSHDVLENEFIGRW